MGHLVDHMYTIVYLNIEWFKIITIHSNIHNEVAACLNLIITLKSFEREENYDEGKVTSPR